LPELIVVLVEAWVVDKFFGLFTFPVPTKGRMRAFPLITVRETRVAVSMKLPDLPVIALPVGVFDATIKLIAFVTMGIVKALRLNVVFPVRPLIIYVVVGRFAVSP
jgi:hypothetical protein